MALNRWASRAIAHAGGDGEGRHTSSSGLPLFTIPPTTAVNPSHMYVVGVFQSCASVCGPSCCWWWCKASTGLMQLRVSSGAGTLGGRGGLTSGDGSRWLDAGKILNGSRWTTCLLTQLLCLCCNILETLEQYYWFLNNARLSEK